MTQGSNGFAWNFIRGNVSALGDDQAPMAWVNILDCAAAHVRALDEVKADGKRFILFAGLTTPRQVAKLARSIDASLNDAAEPEGKLEEHKQYEIIEAKNYKEILGLDYIGVDETLKEIINQGLAERKAGIID